MKELKIFIRIVIKDSFLAQNLTIFDSSIKIVPKTDIGGVYILGLLGKTKLFKDIIVGICLKNTQPAATLFICKEKISNQRKPDPRTSLIQWIPPKKTTGKVFLVPIFFDAAK